MRFLSVAYALALLLLLATIGMLWAQRRRDATNLALRLFVINGGLWVLTDLALVLPAARGFELAIMRVAGLFWIPSTLWYLLFSYRATKRRIDALFIALFCLVAVAAALWLCTDLGLTGFKTMPWGAVDTRGPYHLAFSAVTAVVGLACVWVLTRSILRTEDSRRKRALHAFLVGGAVALSWSFAANVVVPLALGNQDLPRLASCSLGLFVPFIYYAMYRHEFLTTSLARIAEDLFEGVADGIVLFDRGGTIRRANAAARRILGARDDREVAAATSRILEERVLAKGGHGLTTTFERDGETRHLALSISGIRRRGVDLGRMAVINDVTEQLRAEEILRRSRDELELAVEERSRELRQAQKMEALVALAGGIAHDFNNLLAAIQGFATAARDELADGEEDVADAEEILIATRQARDIVRQLLDFSRHTGKQREIFDVGAVAKAVAGLVRVSLPAGVEIRSESASRSTSVLGDQAQIHQVLMNLCTNAAQAMRETGGTIHLCIDEEHLDEPRSTVSGNLRAGAYVRVLVRDDGPGIPSDLLERIFEPFFTTKAPTEGTGLGLAMVQHILHEHGGGISVSSAVGEGTTFIAHLPMARVSAVPSLVGEEVAAERGTESVMVVDDKEQIGRMSRRLLEALGYRVSMFTRPEDALSSFEADPGAFDLVLTDYMMPGLTGLELAQRIKELRPRIPILLFSGNAGPKVVEAGRRIGIAAFLDKPLSKAALARAVRAALDQR